MFYMMLRRMRMVFSVPLDAEEEEDMRMSRMYCIVYIILDADEDCV